MFNYHRKKIGSILVIIFFTFLLFQSIITHGVPEETRETTELYLLRVEHYLELEATANTDTFHVQYVFPPDYEYQVPIVLDLFNDTTAQDRKSTRLNSSHYS